MSHINAYTMDTHRAFMGMPCVHAYVHIFVGASRKTAHAILVPHYVHIYIYLIIFFVCITLCYVIVTLAHVYICMDISGNKLLTYLLTVHDITFM